MALIILNKKEYEDYQKHKTALQTIGELFIDSCEITSEDGVVSNVFIEKDGLENLYKHFLKVSYKLSDKLAFELEDK